MNFTYITILCFLLHYVHFCNSYSPFNINSVKTSELDALLKRACLEKKGDCPRIEMEDEMDSESTRRMLAMQKKYISYGTMKKDFVPCTQPGASYYDCRGGGQANHYNRGCEVITRCARSVNDINS
ncbi:hypothetical protein LIER_06471 [Lithospermum erythrorhizon]|uniref:Uncharacterized protein n=1 Tax=Lithospermum erythrorhizon TaxID=34254 RepID=A0AAV3P4P5_LITER